MKKQFAFILDSPRYGQIVVMKTYAPHKKKDPYGITVIFQYKGANVDMSVELPDSKKQDALFETCKDVVFTERHIFSIIQQ